MAKPFHQVSTVIGTISGSSGYVRFDETLGDKDHFRNSELKTYRDGDRIKLEFRISPNGTRRLIRHSLLKEEQVSLFDIVLDGFDDSQPIQASRELVELLESPLDQVTRILNQVRDGNQYIIMHDVEEEEVPEIMERLEQFSSLMFSSAKTDDKEGTFEVELFPSWIDGYHIDPQHGKIFSVVEDIVADGHCINIMARGDSGYGKTTLFQTLADHLGFDFIRINCAVIQDTVQWFGYSQAKDGTTSFEPTRFTELLQQGRSVILLDEANRIEPWLANSLFSLLDDTRAVEVENMVFECGPSVIFALSINEGIKFSGTHTMDTAFKNRVPITIEVGKKQPEIEARILQERWEVPEELSVNIVTHINELRIVVERDQLEVDVSTRTSLKVAFLMRYGMSMKDAFITTILAAADEFEKKAINDYIEARIN